MDTKRAALLRKHVQDANQYVEITAEDLVSLVDATKYDDPGCVACANGFRPRKAGARIPNVNVNVLTEHVEAMLAKLPAPPATGSTGKASGTPTGPADKDMGQPVR